MTEDDVLEVLAALDAGGVEYWVDGGWGVDAILGKETRPHRDLDLGVRLADVERIEALLPEFRRDSDDEWPGFLLLREGRGRVLDLLLMERGEEGELCQQLAGGRRVCRLESETRARGEIAGRQVRCASVTLQLEHVQDRLDAEALKKLSYSSRSAGPVR